MNYYNEFEPKAAWALRQLIQDGLIPAGYVDDRSIKEVEPDELKKYTQCHFFAGIAGWSHALTLARWETTKPVWTGSCPCQPFSVAGRGGGQNDPRHLWPVWFNLIRECKPSVIFGEQVTEAIKHGWLDLVQDNLEAESYAFAPIGLPACSVGSPHIRKRLWFLAHRVADSASEGGRRSGNIAGQEGIEDSVNTQPAGGSGIGALANTSCLGQSGQCGNGDTQERGITQCGQVGGDAQPDAENTFWSNPDWLYCRDDKWRPVEPGTFPLVDGFPERVALVRAAGNAIVPQVAAEIIKAYMEYERLTV